MVIVRRELKIGDRVAVADSPRVTQELWFAAGEITEARDRPESQYRRREPTHYWLQFDAPRKSVGAVMSGVWVTPELVF